MQDMIAKLQAKRALYEAAMSQIDAKLAQWHKLEKELDELLSGPSGTEIQASVRSATPDTSQESSTGNTQSRKRGPNGSPPEAIIDAAMKAINDAGRSLTRYELVDAVERQGLKIGGTDKPRNMGTILWRSGHFINSGGGYWPKEATHPDSMFQGEDGGEQSIL